MHKRPPKTQNNGLTIKLVKNKKQFYIAPFEIPPMQLNDLDRFLFGWVI